MKRFLFAAAILVAACSKPEPPTIAPRSGTVTAVTPAGVNVRLSLEASNPNGFDIRAQKVTAKLTLDRYDLGTVTTPSAIAIPAHGTQALDVPVSVPWNDLAQIAGIAASATDVPYKLDGTVTLGTEKVNFDVPFHLEGKVPRDQIVKATLNSLPKIPGLPFPAVPAK